MLPPIQTGTKERCILTNAGLAFLKRRRIEEGPEWGLPRR